MSVYREQAELHFKLIKPSILLTRGTQMTGCRRLSLSQAPTAHVGSQGFPAA